jgi:hypothetical protein
MPSKCPVCGCPVRIVKRASGVADHYEPVTVHSEELPVVDKATSDRLNELRKGKKTVALVGAAFSTCSLAPYNDSVEIWALNEEHAYPWMKRADRWFQMHKSEKWHPDNLKWMRENPWNIPIYLQFVRSDIPKSVEYPLQRVVDYFPNFHRGGKRAKYFTSTFSYMMALALVEGYERIEIYGFDMIDTFEYAMQKACGEHWMGVAIGMGVDIYVPPECQLLEGTLYGY